MKYLIFGKLSFQFGSFNTHFRQLVAVHDLSAHIDRLDEHRTRHHAILAKRYPVGQSHRRTVLEIEVVQKLPRTGIADIIDGIFKQRFCGVITACGSTHIGEIFRKRLFLNLFRRCHI